jgi:hypothetical protein
MRVTFVFLVSGCGAGVPASAFDWPVELDDGEGAPAAPAGAFVPADVALLLSLGRDDEQLDITTAAVIPTAPTMKRKLVFMRKPPSGLCDFDEKSDRLRGH